MSRWSSTPLKWFKAKGSAKYATYRYENVRVNASPYVMAGVDAAQVKNLNHHWVVDGKWPSSGKVLVGRDIADAIGLKVGSAITIGYRASDNASSTGTSASSNEGTGSANGETSSSSSQNSSNDMQGMDMSGDMAGMDMSGSSSSDQSSSSQTSNGQSGQSPSDQQLKTAASPATSWIPPAPNSVWPASWTPAAARIRSSTPPRRRQQAHRRDARRGRY